MVHIGRNRHCFAQSPDEIGCNHLHTHKIQTGDAKPVTQRSNNICDRQSHEARKETKKQIEEMLRADVIQPFNFNKEEKNQFRFTVDFR